MVFFSQCNYAWRVKFASVCCASIIEPDNWHN